MYQIEDFFFFFFSIAGISFYKIFQFKVVFNAYNFTWLGLLKKPLTFEGIKQPCILFQNFIIYAHDLMLKLSVDFTLSTKIDFQRI